MTEIIPLRTLALGYLGAYDRLHTALQGVQVQDAQIALFETLSWLDTLVNRNELNPMNVAAHKLVDGLKFARGQVHHGFLSAIELRDDVRHPPVRLGLHLASRQMVDFVDPVIYIDWCWVPTARLRGAGRDPKRRATYDLELAGKPVRFALGQFRDLASFLDISSRDPETQGGV